MSLSVGVIGGGQLARMMIPPAVALGVELRVFAETENSAARAATVQVGDITDADALLEFGRTVDVVTFDHEHVPQEVLARLQAAGIRLHPAPAALRYAQDKLAMRDRLSELGVPVPDWGRADSAEQVTQFLDAHGGRAVAKTPLGGYDGKGVRVISAADQVSDWLPGPLLLEELVSFRRELAQVIARRPSGEFVAWPLVETVQLNGVCAEVIAPAPRSAGKIADVGCDIALRIAEGLEVTGVLAVELFETTDDRLLVNELAMRPHNSGHWSIDGSTTSQFEQHLRAVLDLPLGATGCRDPWNVMVNVLGGPSSGAMTDRYPAAFAAEPTAKVHSYGKEHRPGRKVGHVTVGGEDLDDVAYRARAAAAVFQDPPLA